MNRHKEQLMREIGERDTANAGRVTRSDAFGNCMRPGDECVTCAARPSYDEPLARCTECAELVCPNCATNWRECDDRRPTCLCVECKDL